MRAVSIILNTLVLTVISAPALAQQLPVEGNITPAERPSFLDPMEQADRDRHQQFENAAEARSVLESYGRCTAERNASEASRVLTMDFTTSRYRTGLRLLSQEAERNCATDSVGRENTLRSSNLLFAGAVAEALIESDPAAVNVRLARAAATSAETYSPIDAVALCLSRSLPDQVAALFATAPDSEAEAQAAAPLLQAVPACASAVGIDSHLELSVPAVRAMIATASYRLLSHSEDTDA